MRVDGMNLQPLCLQLTLKYRIVNIRKKLLDHLPQNLFSFAIQVKIKSFKLL